MVNKWTVYIHTNKINGKKYVGITSQKVEYRWGKEGNNYLKCTYFFNAIKKYGWESFSHDVIFSGLTEQEAKEKEVELISQYNTSNSSHGYNLTYGGQGNIPNDATRVKISRKSKVMWENESIRKRIIQSIRHNGQSPKFKRKMSKLTSGEQNGFYGKAHTVETKKKMRIKKEGKKLSSEHKKMVSQSLIKSVVMLDLNGNLLAVFYGISHIKSDVIKTTSHITEVCRGNRKTAGGFKWMYKEDYEKYIERTK